MSRRGLAALFSGWIALSGCGGSAAAGSGEGAGFQDVPAPMPLPAPDTAPVQTEPTPSPPSTPTGSPPPAPDTMQEPPPPPMQEPPPDTSIAGNPAPPVVTPDDPLDAVRQACVDHVNMYRATLGLAPLERATPEQEACSDMGAKLDSEAYAATQMAHGSAGMCPGLGAQNTCPGWPLRFGATLDGTMKQCLDGMWAEGEPPVPVSQCIQDYQNCFLSHGHYINMSSEDSTTVSCGFYEMPDGGWWMNQDFGR